MCEAALTALLVQLLLRAIPFRMIAPHLNTGAKGEAAAGYGKTLAAVTWAVAAIGRRTKWRNRCLVDAITAKWMLKRRGIQAKLSLGLAKDEAKQLQAHAWLQVGPSIITGENDHQRFQVMSTFE